MDYHYLFIYFFTFSLLHIISYLYFLLYSLIYFIVTSIYAILYVYIIPYYLPLSHLHTSMHAHTNTHLYYLYTYHYNFTLFSVVICTVCPLSVLVVHVVWCICPSCHLVCHIISPMKKKDAACSSIVYLVYLTVIFFFFGFIPDTRTAYGRNSDTIFGEESRCFGLRAVDFETITANGIFRKSILAVWTTPGRETVRIRVRQIFV